MRFGVTHAPSLHPPPQKLEAGKSQLHGKTQVFSAVSVGILDSDSLISHENEPFVSGAQGESRGNISSVQQLRS